MKERKYELIIFYILYNFHSNILRMQSTKQILHNPYFDRLAKKKRKHKNPYFYITDFF